LQIRIAVRKWLFENVKERFRLPILKNGVEKDKYERGGFIFRKEAQRRYLKVDYK